MSPADLIRWTCPNCGKPVKARASATGSRVACSRCLFEMVVPETSSRGPSGPRTLRPDGAQTITGVREPPRLNSQRPDKDQTIAATREQAQKDRQKVEILAKGADSLQAARRAEDADRWVFAAFAVNGVATIAILAILALLLGGQYRVPVFSFGMGYWLVVSVLLARRMVRR